MALSQIDQIKIMLDAPKLFISEYYSSLKTEVDLEFAKQKAEEQHLNETQKNLWKQMIEKIEQIELNNLKNFMIDLTRKKQIEARIEAKNQNKEPLDDEINEIKSSLLLKKTILLFKKPQFSDEKPYVYDDEENDEYDEDDEQDIGQTVSEKTKKESVPEDLIYLMMINDAYLDENRVKEWITNNYLEREPELSGESLAYEILREKIQNSESRIIEIDLNLASLDSIVRRSYALEKIHINSFRSFKNLNLIDLRENCLDKINDFTFEGLTSLKNLWLNDNQIEIIGKNAFSSLSSLEWLDLSKNLIKSIDEETFRDLVSLEILDLENNQILSLKQMIFQTNSKLRNLFIQNNPFVDRLILNYATASLNATNQTRTIALNKSIDLKDYLGLFDKNLLKNSDAENGFEYWTPAEKQIEITNRTACRYIIDLIKMSKAKSEKVTLFEIETEQGGVARKLLKEPAQLPFKNFVTSYYLGCKYQVIDLNLEGVDATFLENYKPKIEVGEHYVARNDCGSSYYLDVWLIDDSFQLITSYSFVRTIEQWENLEWQLACHTFEYDDSFKTLRYIVFSHAGKVILFFSLILQKRFKLPKSLILF